VDFGDDENEQIAIKAGGQLSCGIGTRSIDGKPSSCRIQPWPYHTEKSKDGLRYHGSEIINHKWFLKSK
jgi:hypothetical protein